MQRYTTREFKKKNLGFKNGREFKKNLEKNKLKNNKLKERVTSHRIWGHGDQ
jgi:hypothetical protein